MPVMTLFSSIYCGQSPIVEALVSKTGYLRVTDGDLAAKAARLSGMNEKKILAAIGSKTSVFNKFTHEKERSLAWLRLAVAETLPEENLLIDGFAGLMVPKEITHALRVCLVADMKSRLDRAQAEGVADKDALNRIRTADEDRAAWVNTLFGIRDPWQDSLYDIVIPTDKSTPEQSVVVITENLRNEVIRPTENSRRAAEDFRLAAKTGVALAMEGHNVEVIARDGAVTLVINKNVLMLGRLEAELKSVAEKVEGVKSVETRIGKGFHQADIYRKYDFDMPKLLLVDDEREFVQTLSERLMVRDVESAVAYDGESALSILEEDEPEVMILDLKMPGIDGIEVLRKVKETRPEVEVIILTGHGSEKDRETCMALGAFAYLQKPVNIEMLTETLKQANAEMRRKKAAVE